MSSRRPSLRLAAAALLVAAALAGCSGDGEAAAARHHGPPDVVKALNRSLEARADAVRRGDADRFARLLGGSRAFHDRQRTWFTNLGRLPVARLSYRLDPATLVRNGGAYTAVVDESLRLAGYDAAPVVATERMRFVPVPRRPGRFRLAALTDDHPQPWDL